MDYKKTNAPTNTVTRDMSDFASTTGNVYESISIIGKRSNQIAAEMKEELLKKLNEFSSTTDNLEEQFENHEHVTMRDFQSLHLSRLRSSLMARYTSAILQRTLKRRRNWTRFTVTGYEVPSLSVAVCPVVGFAGCRYGDAGSEHH